MFWLLYDYSSKTNFKGKKILRHSLLQKQKYLLRQTVFSPAQLFCVFSSFFRSLCRYTLSQNDFSLLQNLIKISSSFKKVRRPSRANCCKWSHSRGGHTICNLQKWFCIVLASTYYCKNVYAFLGKHSSTTTSHFRWCAIHTHS